MAREVWYNRYYVLLHGLLVAVVALLLLAVVTEVVLRLLRAGREDRQWARNRCRCLLCAGRTPYEAQTAMWPARAVLRSSVQNGCEFYMYTWRTW